jgi:hypothetical protein
MRCNSGDVSAVRLLIRPRSSEVFLGQVFLISCMLNYQPLEKRHLDFSACFSCQDDMHFIVIESVARPRCTLAFPRARSPGLMIAPFQGLIKMCRVLTSSLGLLTLFLKWLRVANPSRNQGAWAKLGNFGFGFSEPHGLPRNSGERVRCVLGLY